MLVASGAGETGVDGADRGLNSCNGPGPFFWNISRGAGVDDTRGECCDYDEIFAEKRRALQRAAETIRFQPSRR